MGSKVKGSKVKRSKVRVQKFMTRQRSKVNGGQMWEVRKFIMRQRSWDKDFEGERLKGNKGERSQS